MTYVNVKSPWLHPFSPASLHSTWTWQNVTLCPPRKVIRVTFIVFSVSTLLLCLFRLKAISHCQTIPCTLSLHGAGRVKCEPLCLLSDRPISMANCSWWHLTVQPWQCCCHLRVYGSVEARRDTQTTASSADSCFCLTDTVGLQEAWCFKGGTIVCVSVVHCDINHTY